MTYVLGTAAATGAPPCLQFTVQGDGLESLAKAYGVTALEIWKLQPEAAGKSMIVQNVEPFVRSRSGWSPSNGLLPFKPGGKPNNPSAFGVGVPGQGFAHFTANTQLMLPDMARLDGKKPRDGGPGTPPPQGDDGVSQAGAGIGAVLFLGATIALFVLGRKKKPKKV